MKRILTAFLLVPITIYTVLFAPWPVFVAVVAIVASLCFREYAAITGAFAPLGYVAGLLILVPPPAETRLILFLTALPPLCLPVSSASFVNGARRAAALMLGVGFVFGRWETPASLLQF